MSEENPFAVEITRRQSREPAAPAASAKSSNPFAAEIARRQARPPAAAKDSPTMDALKSLGSGVVRGASELALTPVTLGNLGQRAMHTIVGAVEGAGRYALGMPPVSAETKAKREQAQKEGGFGVNGAEDAFRANLDRALHEPQSKTAAYARTVGEMIPGAIAMPGSTAARALNAIRFGVVPGVTSEAAGQATKGTKWEPAARAVAGVLGSFAGPAILNAPSRVVSPLTIPEARRPLVDALRREGVEMTAGQETGSKPLQWLESAISDAPFAGGGAERIAERQRSQFTNAGLARMGVAPVEGQLATPDVMRQGARAIGDRFNDLSSRNVMAKDQAFRDAIDTVRRDYRNAAVPAQQRPMIENIIADLSDPSFALHGERYQNTRSMLTKQADALRFADPPAADALRGVRDAMDAAMTRSISPADAAAWNEARRHYGNMKTLEKAMAGAGEQTAQGALSPAQLRSAVAARSKSDYVRGHGDLVELARAGAGVLPPLPNSGTVPRQQAMRMIGALEGGGAVGALIAGHPAAAVASVAAPALAGRALMSTPIQAYLRNQAVTRLRSNPPAAQRAGAAALGLTESRGLSDMFAPAGR
ncbi:hypothetical protein [Methylocapsa acidiphila]|uniref:hypothetical protein n=1 Tax=Methylocapsa acidiphila TaxID=133552 RepID=UPI00040FBA70|nr:hypothetical protein [Methylocapsa acidiphila]